MVSLPWMSVNITLQAINTQDAKTGSFTIYILEKWLPLKSERGHSLYFFVQHSPPFSSLLSCSFYLLDLKTISSVDILEMT